MSFESKYELLYRKQSNVCGKALPEFINFAQSYQKPNATVLDLGCGQGRDALIFASQGFEVTGVDVSPTGIEQMKAQALTENISISGVVCDIKEFEVNTLFDIIVLDRILHMLGTNKEKLQILERCKNWLAPSGYILIADEPSNVSVFCDWFSQDSRPWKVIEKMKQSFCFAHSVK